MSDQRKKSAKDIAFDKERVKYRQEIRKLESELSKAEKMIANLKEVIGNYEETLREKEDHIERLLEYANLSKEEQELLLNKEKVASQISSIFSILPNAFKHFP